ncbi:Trm112 family protein [Halopseudomonas pachastrellae]|nr:Trm112 family protein [Halopseudomonas pachastrellae]
MDVLACPLCKGPLVLSNDKQELWCRADGLAFPVRDGIPVMLESEARALDADEKLGG